MLMIYLSLLETEEQKNKFEMIYHKYAGLMYHEACAVTKDHFLAEDVIHETFLQLIQIIDNVRVDNSKELAQFIKIITHSRAVDYVRKLDHVRPEEDEVLANRMAQITPDPETIAVDSESFERIVNEVMQLSDIYRAPLSLKIKGYKIEEIAKILEINSQTVKVRLHRARKILLASLEAGYES